MGLLTGSYFKTMATKMRLHMQHQLMNAQSTLIRVQKQIDSQERMLNMQQRNSEMMLKAQMNASIWGPGGAAAAAGIDPNNPMGETNQADMYAFQQTQAQMQYRYANAQSVWSNYFESVREATLEPLKNQETELTQRIESIKNRMETYKMMEETGEKMKQDSRKDFMPSQGG